MKYYRNIADGYIVSLEKRETSANGDEITETQYNEIISLLGNRPIAPDGYAYRLTAKMEWELCEITDVEYAEVMEKLEQQTEEE